VERYSKHWQQQPRTPTAPPRKRLRSVREDRVVELSTEVRDKCRGSGLTEAFERAKGYHATGYPSSTLGSDGGRGGDTPDPTYQGMKQRQQAPNRIYEEGVKIANEFEAAALALIQWINATTGGGQATRAICSNAACDDDFPVHDATRSAVRCEPCQRYLEKHGTDASRQTVDARKRKREERGT
jgi:hypothetical protein